MIELSQNGFIVIDGEVLGLEADRLIDALDRAEARAAPHEMRVGTTTTRVNGLIGDAAFEALWNCAKLAGACRMIIGESFKLSSLHSRAVHPGAAAQDLHIDFRPDEPPFPLVGFVYMIDEFTERNGATRFVPGSHRWPAERLAEEDERIKAEAEATLATGRAGSLIIFDGRTWHGHTRNLTATPRRSIQGAFVPEELRQRG